MSVKEIFNKVKDHLLTQNMKAFDPIEHRCAYRMGNLKCAAGCLIPDEDYRPEMEGYSIFGDFVEPEDLNTPINVYMYSKFDKDELDVIIKLQRIHDRFFPEEWKSKLEDLEKELNL